jgi:hypothetical protein
MKFRRKPVVIDAYQIPPDDGAFRPDVPAWLSEAILSAKVRAIPGGGCIIHTLEGDHRGNVGDWIIRGVKGELYPCKPDIFEATYERADSAT